VTNTSTTNTRQNNSSDHLCCL